MTKVLKCPILKNWKPVKTGLHCRKDGSAVHCVYIYDATIKSPSKFYDADSRIREKKLKIVGKRLLTLSIFGLGLFLPVKSAFQPS